MRPRVTEPLGKLGAGSVNVSLLVEFDPRENEDPRLRGDDNVAMRDHRNDKESTTMRSTVSFLAAGVISFLVAGCATSFNAKKQDEELSAKLAALETRIDQTHQRLEEIAQRQQAAEPAQPRESRSAEIQKTASNKTGTALAPREIQVALKTSGYYAGPVDGKMGPQTLEAVRAFQRAKGLTPDGKVGSRTAAALAKHLTHE